MTNASQVDSRTKDRENARLRMVINVYIKSEEMNDPVWALMDEDEGRKADYRGGHANIEERGHENDGSQPLTTTALGFCRKDVIDTGRAQLVNLSKLEIELNQVLANVLKEKDRQRLLVSDLMLLMETNKEIFGAGRRVNSTYVAGDAQVVVKADASVQVDKKDEYGVVQDNIVSPREEIESHPPLSDSSIKVRGSTVPFQLRKFMASFPRVLRVPSAAWCCQTIMAIYFDKIRIDAERSRCGQLKQPLCVHVYDYFTRTLGQQSIVDIEVSQFLAACEYHMNKIKRVSLFASQLGIYNKESPPSLDVRDTEYIISIIANLLTLGDLHQAGGSIAGGHAFSKDSASGVGGVGGISVRPDVLRASAIKTTETVLSKWLQDNGHDYVVKVKALAGTEKGSRFVDIDEFIELMIEPWHTIRQTWEEHARYLFHHNCTVHSVMSEAQFATDIGAKERDSVLVQVQKASATDCLRRRMRTFQHQLAPESNRSDASAGRIALLGNPSKEVRTRRTVAIYSVFPVTSTIVQTRSNPSPVA